MAKQDAFSKVPEPVYWGPAAQGEPKQLVVLCHGLGADAYDLIDLGPAWSHACPNALFASVHALFRHDSGFGRQWWSVADRSPPAVVAGARPAASYLNMVIDAELERLALPADAYALAGFSQGAMIAPETLATECANRAAVLLVHGEADEAVSVSRSHDAEAALRAEGVPVEAHFIPRLGHGIDDIGIAVGALALQRAFA